MHPTIAFAAFQTGSLANGGLESLTSLLAGLDAERVVITQLESPFTERWRALGCRVEVIDVPPVRPLRGAAHLAYTLARGPRLAGTNLRGAQRMAELGVSVLHCNDAAAFWYVGLGARAIGVPVLVNVRGTKEADSTYGAKWRTMRHLVQEIVVLSADMAKEIDRRVPPLSQWIPIAPVRHIYTGLSMSLLGVPSPEERSALRRSLGIEESVCAVGHVGVFNENKNQLELIEEVLPKVMSEHADVRMFFIGDFDPETNGYAARCRDAASRRGLSGRVRFVGFTADMPAWYRSLDVVCVTSRHEGLPRAMIEGLACGVPTVSTDVVSAREILEAHGCGRVVGCGDHEGFARALSELVAGREARRAMGQSGARVARTLFDPTSCRRAYMETYERLAGASRSRGRAPKARSQS